MVVSDENEHERESDKAREKRKYNKIRHKEQKKYI